MGAGWGPLWDMGVMVGHGEDRMLPNLEAEVLQGAKDGCQGMWVPGLGVQGEKWGPSGMGAVGEEAAMGWDQGHGGAGQWQCWGGGAREERPREWGCQGWVPRGMGVPGMGSGWVGTGVTAPSRGPSDFGLTQSPAQPPQGAHGQEGTPGLSWQVLALCPTHPWAFSRSPISWLSQE